MLYNLPTEMEADEKHILSVFVENTSGTLSKISGLLAARGFNIDTLTVASSNIAGVSRMTVVLSCSHSQMLQARKQVEDLVDVWAVVDASADTSGARGVEGVAPQIDETVLTELRRLREERSLAKGKGKRKVFRPQ